MKYLFIAIPLFLASCHQSRIIEPKPLPVEEQKEKCEGGQIAIIKPFELDGCTWVLELSNGEKIEPMNYKEFLSVEDLEPQQPLKVKVTFNDTKSATICMIGRTVAITCLERLE